MNPELYWISGPWRGRLAVLTRPRGGDWIDDEIGGWKLAGLHMVVSLLEKQEAAELELSREGDAARAEGVEFLSFPIPDRGVPISMAPARSLLRNITEALDKGQNVAFTAGRALGVQAWLRLECCWFPAWAWKRRFAPSANPADKRFRKLRDSMNGCGNCPPTYRSPHPDTGFSRRD